MQPHSTAQTPLHNYAYEGMISQEQGNTCWHLGHPPAQIASNIRKAIPWTPTNLYSANVVIVSICTARAVARPAITTAGRAGAAVRKTEFLRCLCHQNPVRFPSSP